MIRLYATLCLSITLAAGCASDISPDGELQGDGAASESPTGLSEPGPGGPQAHFSQTENGDFKAVVDATGSDWIYLDLDTQTQVFPDAPEASDGWDWAHRGHEIKLNGGSSGQPPGGIEVEIYADKVEPGTPYPWNSVYAAPPRHTVDYVSDSDDGGLLGLGLVPGTQSPVYAMTTYPEADQQASELDGSGDHGWYHDSGIANGNQITARTNVAYILRTDACRYISLRMSSFSNQDAQQGFVSYELRPVTGSSCDADGTAVPLGAASFTATGDGMRADVDASSEDAWVYLDLSNATQVVPQSPEDDPQGWDIAFKRTDIKMNGGSSGTGSVSLHDMLRGDWDATHQVPVDAQFHSDEAAGLAFINYPPAERNGDASCGGINSDFGWYYYSGFCDDGQGVHHISPRDVVYIINGRDGQSWKLRMQRYYSEEGEAAHPRFEYAPLAR